MFVVINFLQLVQFTMICCVVRDIIFLDWCGVLVSLLLALFFFAAFHSAAYFS